MRSTGIGVVAARGERLLGLVAAAAADLHASRRRSPRRGRCSTPSPPPPRGGCRSRRGPTSRSRGSPPTPWRRCVAAMSAILWAIASCLPIGLAPLHALVRPAADDLEARPWRCPTQMFGIESRPSLRVVRAILRPLPSSPIRFSARHAHVLEADHRVRERPQAHEAAAVLDLDARPVGLDHEAR